jgi:hypothetical protein
MHDTSKASSLRASVPHSQEPFRISQGWSSSHSEPCVSFAILFCCFDDEAHGLAGAEIPRWSLSGHESVRPRYNFQCLV